MERKFWKWNLHFEKLLLLGWVVCLHPFLEVMWLISYLGKKENGPIIHSTPCPSYGQALLFALFESDVEWMGKIFRRQCWLILCLCFHRLVWRMQILFCLLTSLKWFPISSHWWVHFTAFTWDKSGFVLSVEQYSFQSLEIWGLFFLEVKEVANLDIGTGLVQISFMTTLNLHFLYHVCVYW